MLTLYRDLAALRRARAELTDPWFSGVRVDCDDDQRWLLIDRSGVRIAVNFSDDDRVIPLGGSSGPVLLETRAGVQLGGESLTLPGHTAVVIAPAAGAAR